MHFSVSLATNLLFSIHLTNVLFSSHFTDVLFSLHLTLWRADATIGIIQKLPTGGRMMQCVSTILKFAKNRVILLLYLRFVTYMHKKLWDLTLMHRLQVVVAWVQPLATDSAMLTAVECGIVRVAVLSLWCLAFSL